MVEPGEDDEAEEVVEVERLSGGVETAINFESSGESFPLMCVFFLFLFSFFFRFFLFSFNFEFKKKCKTALFQWV